MSIHTAVSILTGCRKQECLISSIDTEFLEFCKEWRKSAGWHKRLGYEDLVDVKVINGQKFIVIRADEGVELNGLNVNIEE